MPKLFTVEEIAQLLKLNPETIRRYIKKGILKAVKLERQYRIKEEDLSNFLKGKRK